MGRFAAMVILFAILFAMLVPSDLGSLAPEDDSERPPTYAASVADDSAEAEPDRNTEPAAMPLSSEGTTLSRGNDGQFHIDAQINGQPVKFLVDTGADQVALTVEEARRIGIDFNPAEFEPVGMGAGGIVHGQRVSLDSVSVVGHDIGALDAVVLDGLTHNLLGQSVLRQIASLELRGDTMIIR